MAAPKTMTPTEINGVKSVKVDPNEAHIFYSD